MLCKGSTPWPLYFVALFGLLCLLISLVVEPLLRQCSESGYANLINDVGGTWSRRLQQLSATSHDFAHDLSVGDLFHRHRSTRSDQYARVTRPVPAPAPVAVPVAVAPAVPGQVAAMPGIGARASPARSQLHSAFDTMTREIFGHNGNRKDSVGSVRGSSEDGDPHLGEGTDASDDYDGGDEGGSDYYDYYSENAVDGKIADGDDDDDDASSEDDDASRERTIKLLRLGRLVLPITNQAGTFLIFAIFAVFYKAKVVNRKAKLGPPPTGRVAIPEGAQVGSALTVALSNGLTVQVLVPPGVPAGDWFDFEVPGSGRGFRHGLCSCLNNCHIFWTVWWCHPTRIADTYASAGVMEFWPTFLLVTCVPCCFFWLIAPCKRAEIRARLGGDRNGCTTKDFCIAIWCSTCMMCQESQAVDQALQVRTKCCCLLESAEAHIPLVGAGVGDPVMVSGHLAYDMQPLASLTGSAPREDVVEGRPVPASALLQAAGRDISMQNLTYQSPEVTASQ